MTGDGLFPAGVGTTWETGGFEQFVDDVAGRVYPPSAGVSRARLVMAERDLSRLIAGLAPEARPVPYVVVETDLDVPAAAVIVEDEATTRIVEQAVADANDVPYRFVAAWITCTVESDLEAIGMTAAISRALADAEIPCNVLAGSRHDHLLVPWHRRDDAVAVLRALAD